jgi:hypothetical protein
MLGHALMVLAGVILLFEMPPWCRIFGPGDGMP